MPAQLHGAGDRALRPAHERVIPALRAWDIRLDESLFLGGGRRSVFEGHRPTSSSTIRHCTVSPPATTSPRVMFRMGLPTKCV